MPDGWNGFEGVIDGINGLNGVTGGFCVTDGFTVVTDG